ncbi:MAG: hypothetical protein JXR25_10010 [Pontiellaceae bacterium]|nr:hypothetical protein [Pontiellaceae bacterium]MBN2785152.1 hypothetical protein [Pontiellaceae bacterium]
MLRMLMTDSRFLRELAVQTGISSVGAVGAGLKTFSEGCSALLGPMLMAASLIWTILRIVKTVREMPGKKSKGENE